MKREHERSSGGGEVGCGSDGRVEPGRRARENRRGERVTNGDPLIQIDHVVKVYRRDALEIPVLNDVNLKVPAAEYVALMGPSGSGKTTLLNLIVGFVRRTRGRIVLH